MRKLTIAIIGSEGVIGSANRHLFEMAGYDVISHDLTLKTDIKIVRSADVIYICVPTPTDDNGYCDTSIVERVIRDLDNLGYRGHVGIKSTVSPGTCDRIKNTVGFTLSSVPEILRERVAQLDATENHKILVVGTDSDAAFEIIIRSHGKYPKQIARLKPIEAELFKVFHNNLAALRISWANEAADICKAVGADYREIKECLLHSTQLPDAYLHVFTKLKGFSGPCLPKDTKALLTYAQSLKIDTPVMKALIESNEKREKTVWEGMRE